MQTLRSSLYLTLPVLALGIATGSATADGTTALILTTGDAARSEHVKWVARAWLTTHGSRVSDGGLRPNGASNLASCLRSDSKGCKDVIDRTSIDRLWLFQLESRPGERGTDLSIVLSVFDADGNALATDERYCDRCRPETLTAQVETILEAVSEAALSRMSARTVIRVRSEPPGALVAIDGKSVGTAAPELEYRVNPGEHEVRASLPGHEAAGRRVRLRDGEEKRVVLRLVADPSHGLVRRTTASGWRRSPWPYVLGGAGGVALGTGAALLVIHEPAERDGAERYYERDVRIPGIILTATGAVVTGAVAAYWIVRSLQDDAAPVVPSAAIADSSLVLGLHGRF